MYKYSQSKNRSFMTKQPSYRIEICSFENINNCGVKRDLYAGFG